MSFLILNFINILMKSEKWKLISSMKANENES